MMRFFEDTHDDVSLAELALQEARLAAARGDSPEDWLARVLELEAPLEVCWARLEYARMRLGNGDAEGAEEMLREADKAAANGRWPELLLEIAAAWRAAGHPMCAEQAARRVLEILGAQSEPVSLAELAEADLASAAED